MVDPTIEDVDNLALIISIHLLSEWLAIDHDKTSLESGQHWEDAVGLVAFLHTIGYRLEGDPVKRLCESRGYKVTP